MIRRLTSQLPEGSSLLRLFPDSSKASGQTSVPLDWLPHILSMAAVSMRRWRSVRPIAYRDLNCRIAAYFFFVRSQRDIIPQVGSQACRIDFRNKNHHVGKPGSFDTCIQIPLLRHHVGQRTGLGCGQLTLSTFRKDLPFVVWQRYFTNASLPLVITRSRSDLSISLACVSQHCLLKVLLLMWSSPSVLWHLWVLRGRQARNEFGALGRAVADDERTGDWSTHGILRRGAGELAGV